MTGTDRDTVQSKANWPKLFGELAITPSAGTICLDLEKKEISKDASSSFALIVIMLEP